MQPLPKNLGLADNDLVEVTSEAGKIHIQLQVTQAIRPDCVYLTPGYGHLSKGLTMAYGVGACDSDLHVTYHRSDQRRPGPQPDVCNGKEN